MPGVDWKLRRIIRRPNGTVAQTDWPGNPAPFHDTQRRMVTEAAADISLLNFDTLKSLDSNKCYVERDDGQRREYDMFKA